MNSETSQNNASNCNVYACEEPSAEPSAAEALSDDSAEPEATLVIKLGYRGAAFCGFAEQPTQRTVAGDLRRALQTVLRREVELTCAGRTDAGVYESKCVVLAHGGTPLESTTYKFAKALQRLFCVIKGITDKGYITNSYHVHVAEDASVGGISDSLRSSA